MPDPGISVLILAAGASRRMGKPKLLIEWQGLSLLEKALLLGQSISPDRVSIVLGSHYERYFQIIDINKVNIVRNENWTSGMGTSIACGVEAISNTWPHANGIMIMLADQPLMTAQHLNELITEFNRNPGFISATEYPNKKRGVPAVFPPEYFEELMSLNSDKGARDLLNSKAHKIVTVYHAEVILDIDTPEDLKTLQQLNRRS